MDATFTVFGLTAHTYGLCAAVATLLLLLLMGLIGYKERMPAGTVRVFGLVGIPLGIVGARLVYCAINFAEFTETYSNPWLMLNFFDGGLSMTGLLCGLLVAAFITSRIMNVRYGKALDVMSVPMGLFIAILRFGERFTDLGVGKAVEEGTLTAAMPWLFLKSQVGINTEYRLAVYNYEAAVALLLFVAMLIVFLCVRKHKNRRLGDLALLFFTLYGASQTLLESMRDDGHLLITFLRVAQVAAALMPLIAAGIWSKRYIHINGRSGLRIWLSWLVLVLCIAGLVLLEFSLDGRFTWGTPSLGRDYAIMAALCVLLAAVPCSLYSVLSKRLYRQDHIAVHVPKA